MIVEIIISAVLSILIFCGGFWAGYNLAPKSITNNHTDYITTTQETTSMQGQIQLTIKYSNSVSNININFNKFTNISILIVSNGVTNGGI